MPESTSTPFATVAEVESQSIVGNAHADYDIWGRLYATVCDLTVPVDVRVACITLADNLTGETTFVKNEETALQWRDELLAIVAEATATAQLVKAVKEHAVANYEQGGWDVIVECWEDAQIADHIEGAASVEEAIAKFKDLIEVWSDQQAEADSHRETF